MIELFSEYKIDGVIHLAAESHVDRSINDPFTFARTNVMGTLSLLQTAKLTWESLSEGYEGKRFYHISTDEVYGALDLTNPSGNKDGRGPYGHDFLRKPRGIVHTVRILLLKQVVIILYVLFTTLIICLQL